MYAASYIHFILQNEHSKMNIERTFENFSPDNDVYTDTDTDTAIDTDTDTAIDTDTDAVIDTDADTAIDTDTDM